MHLGPCVHSVKAIMFLGCLMPVAALIVCITLCIHMGKCLTTHCTVSPALSQCSLQNMNILPSLSAAVSDEMPQRAIWLTSILLSSLIRVLLIPHGYACYKLTFSRTVGGDLHCIIKTMFIINIVEILFLNIMSIFPSASQYGRLKIRSL